MAELTAYEKAQLRIKEAEAKAKEKGKTALEALRGESTFDENVDFDAMSAYDKARYKLSIAEQDAKDMGVGVMDVLRARNGVKNADEAVTEALFSTLGKPSGIDLARLRGHLAEANAQVEESKVNVGKLIETPEKKQEREAKERFAQTMEELRLRPLYDYLTTEGEVENGIPRGEELRKLVEKNSGLTEKDMFYGSGQNMKDYYHAQYMLNPEYDSANDTYTKWNKKYPKPTEAIMKPSEDGYYHIGGMRYSHDDMVGAIKGYIPYAQSNRLYTFNKHYRDDIARLNGYKNHETYLKKRLAEIDKEAKEINERTGLIPWMEGNWWALLAPTIWMIDEASGGYKANSLVKHNLTNRIVTNDGEYTGNKWLDKQIHRGHSFVAGLGEKFDISEVGSLGVVGLWDSIETSVVLNKVKNGKKLTEREKDIYRLWELGVEVEQLDKELIGDEFNAASVGRGAGASQEFMAQMIIGFFLTQGIGNTISMVSQGGKIFATEGTKQLTKQVTKEIAKTTTKKLAKKVTAETWEEISKRQALVYLGKNLGVHAGRSAVITTLSPMTWQNFMQRRNGQYSLQDGQIVFNKTSWASDFFKAYTETYFEVFSEMLGAELSMLINVSPARFGKIIGLNKWGGKAGKATLETLNRLSNNHATRRMLGKIGMQGLAGETLSEVSGDVLTSLTLMPFYDEYNMKYLGDWKYWSELASVCAVLGTTHAMFKGALNATNWGAINRAATARDRALGAISVGNLKNELTRISALETNKEIADALANLDIAQYPPMEAAAAIEYIANDMVVKASYGVIFEGSRMSSLGKMAQQIEKLAYEKGDSIIQITTMDGKSYIVKAGDMSNELGMLDCVDVNGKKVSVLVSNIASVKQSKIRDLMLDIFNALFSKAAVSDSVSEMHEVVGQMKATTREQAQQYLEEKGFVVYKEGDIVTLADGSQAEVVGFNEKGEYTVAEEVFVDGTLETNLMQVPFMQVLQPDATIAEGQKAMFQHTMQKTMDDAVDGIVVGEEEGIESNKEKEAIEEEIVEDVKEMPKPIPTREDGSVDYDAIDDAEVFAEQYANEMGSREDAYADVTQMRDSARANAQSIREKGAKAANANEKVDARKKAAMLEARANFYDEVLKHLSPEESVETATDEVKETEEVAPTYKVGDIVEHEGKQARVLSVEDDGVLVIDYGMSNIVDEVNIAVVNADEVKPSTEIVPSETTEQLEEQEIGLVINGFSAQLTPEKRKVYDAFAKLLKAKIVFVESLNGANGQIDVSNNIIYLAWNMRNEGVTFLVGHEGLHRMKVLSPEGYAKFTKAVQRYHGTKGWKKKVADMRKKYEDTNKIRTRRREANTMALEAVEAQIAQNGSVEAVKEQLVEIEKGENKVAAIEARNARYALENAENALTDKGTPITLQTLRTQLAEEISNIPPQLNITDELMQEEVVADTMGEMSEKYHALENFFNHINDSRVLRVLRNVWRYLTSLFTNLGLRTEAMRAKTLIRKMDEFIVAASKAEGKVAKTGEVKRSIPSLVGVHNITLDKLRKSIKMGGLANPSVAVIDVDKQTFDGYGEYSLVLPKNMVDAQQGNNAGTWAGDAWTPMYPIIVRRITDDEALSRFYKDVEALPKAMQNRVRNEFEEFVNGRKLDGLGVWYLFEKNGDSAIKYVPSRYSNEVSNAVKEATNGSFSLAALTPEEMAKCLDIYIAEEYNGDKEAFEAALEQKKKELEQETIFKSEKIKEWRREKLAELNEYGFDYDAVAGFLRDVGKDMRESGVVDVRETIESARKKIEANNLEADYEAWLNSLDERYGIKEYIFDGHAENGDPKYLPHTVENVSKWMREQGRQGAVGMFPTFNVFLATALPHMTTLESIRKRKALLGKSKEEHDAFMDKWGDVYAELATKIHTEGNVGYWRLIEAVGKDNPKEFIKKEYGIELSEEDMAKFDDMVNAIRTEYPAGYFETKFERPLQLSDFTAAVVPNDIPSDVESRLKDAGVEVIEYEKGDNASRAEAMQKASQMENVRFSLPVIQGLNDALNEYKVNGDIATFVEKVREVNDKVALGHPMIESKLDAYDDDGDAEWFAEKIEEIVDDFDGGYAPYAAGDVRYSLYDVNERFNAELATLTEENKDKVILSLGTPSEKLLAGGVVNKPMKLYGAKVIKKQKLHGFDLSEIKNLPLAVANPIAVFNNYQSDENRSVLTELTTKDGNFLVSLNVGKGEDIDFNIVATVFGKGDDNIVDWFNRGLATYIDKEKALDYLHHSALNAEALSNPRLISTAKIIKDFPNPKISTKNSLITPEMDATYLDAVERGDMATAQKMVMEAAKLAMPNTKVVDEDGNPKVVYHGTPNNFNAFSKEMFGTSTDRGIWGNGFYFSDSEQYAKTYEKRGDKQGRTLTVFLNIENPLFISLRNGGNEGAMYFHELMEKHFTDDIYEDATRTDELMSVAQERLSADIVANGYDGIVVEYTNHIDTEYVAFEPNQIKSADPVTYDDNGNVIPLSERFNPEKEDIRYSLIGEQGASALDAYEEATTRLDNLNVAREMEAQGKDALAIKQATGWERGKDGLWRYEVADYVNMFDFTGNVDYMRRHPEYKRYKELLRKRNAGMMFFKKGLTKEEQKEFDDLAIVYGNGVQPHNSHKLKDYLDSEELFAAYPQLRDINVEMKKELEDGAYGRYIPSRNTIELATRTHEYMARTLFHEVQHAIQHIEGFANGGNTEIADPRKVRERKEAMEGLQRKIDMHERTLERFEAELSELNDSMEKWWKSHPEAMSREDFDSEMQALSEVYDEQLKKAEREQNKLRETQKEYKKFVESSATLGYEGYERLAGEVEARATARRVGMSEEERRNTLQLNDEDVARKDQIILRNGLFENYADANPHYSISAPSYTDRMVDISDVMSIAEQKALMLENAKSMALEGIGAQKIVDETGWIELEDGWHYYGDADIVLSDAKANKLRIQRWLESKRAVKRAQVQNMYAPLIKEQEALISDLEKGRAVKGRTSANYANVVEAILDGQAVESLPIEDQILVDIALGQKLRWADEKDGSRRGLATELGLRNAKAEKMDAVTRGAKDYIEDYVAALVERNKGYENGIDDNDVRNAVIEAFRSYPSRQAALDELSARYPNASVVEAREGIARLEFERDEALAEIDADHRTTMEDFEVNTERYMREYEDAQMWNENIDSYTRALARARDEIKRLEVVKADARTSAAEKQAAVKALKTHIRNMLRGDVSRYLRKRDMQALMNAVNEAQTTFAMARAIDKAMWTIFEVRMRKEYARMNNLLKMRIVLNETNIDVESYLKKAVKEGKVTPKDARNLLENYWKGVNAGGLVVARYVDGDTANVVNFVHEHSDYAKLVKNGVADFNEYCDELERMLKGEAIEGKYFAEDAVKKYGALDESVRERMVDAMQLVRGYLEVQDMMTKIKQSSESAQISDEIAKLKEEIDILNAEIEEMRNSGKVVKEGELLKDKEKTVKDKKKQIADLNKAVIKARMSDANLYMGSMPNIVDRMYQLNTAVEGLLKDGRVRLAERNADIENRRRALAEMALDDIDRPAALGRTEADYTTWEKIRASKLVDWILSALMSFDHVLRKAARNAPNGEGRLFRYFTEQISRANNDIYDAEQAAYEELSAKTKALFGTEFDRTMRRADRTKIGKYDSRHDKEVKRNGVRDNVVGTKWVDISVSNALDIVAMWDQPNGKATLEKQGFTEEKIAKIKAALNKNNPKWLEFEKWVVNEFLPTKRVKYNNVYREMNGVDMDYEVNYFPMRRDKEQIPTEVDITSTTFVNAPKSSTTTGGIIRRTQNVLPFDLSVSFFGVIKEHIVEMEEWAGMAPVTRDLNLLLSNPAVKKSLEAVNKGFFKQFADAAKVATNNYTDTTSEFEHTFLAVAQRMWAAARLAWKAFTALKQLASGILFLPYARDAKFIGRLLWYYTGGNIPLSDRAYQHIAHGANYDIQSNRESHVNITWALENSAMFRKRWASGAAGNNIFTRDMVYGEGKTRLGRMLNDVMKGVDSFVNMSMRGIALVDAFTSAAGLRAIYEQELILLQKEGMSREEAHEIAMFRAEMAVNKTQQSAENLYLAPVQKNRGAIATMLTMFQNASFAQGRNIAEATRELTRDRDAEYAWLVNDEMKHLRKVNAALYEQIEDIIKKEKEQGIITNQKEEDMRREQLRKDEDSSLMPEAEKRAKMEMRSAKLRSVFTLFMNAWIGPAVFNAMQYLPYLIMGDDDEEKMEMLKIWGWQTLAGPLGAMPLGSSLISGLMGYGFDYASPLTDTTDDFDKIWKVAKEEGFNADVAMLGAEWLLEWLAGVDLQTFEQMYSGVESMIVDGYSREALLNILGSPKSQVRLLAGERKDGETFEQYATRIMRLYSIFEQPTYDEYYEDGKLIDTPFGVKPYILKGMEKDYEKDYREDILGDKENKTYLAVEAKYDSIYDTMGWKDGSNPNEKAWVWKGDDNNGEWVFVPPVKGMTQEEFYELYILAEKSIECERDARGFIGSDAEYLEKVRKEIDAKQAFNDKFSEITNK